MIKIIISVICLLVFTATVTAGLSREDIQAITKEIQKYDDSWTVNKTFELLDKGRSAAEFIYANDDFQFKKMRDNVFVNGKVVVGNMGKKETHGDYSPIIGNLKDSNIAIGPKAEINEKSFNINSTIALKISIALSFSFSLYLIIRYIRKKRANNSME